MNVLSTDIEGLVVVQPPIHSDERGSFVKTYNEALFKNLGIGFRPREEFFSISHRNVIRGMHFQLPPADHAKVVYCLTGSILDVVLDLRTGGRTYGKWWTRELNDVSRELVHIPLGCAHGFLSLTEGA